MPKFFIAVCFLLSLFLFAGEPPATSVFDPTAIYKQADIQGFAVLINPKVVEHEPDARAMWAEVEKQLKHIVQIVPDAPLAEFRKSRIWVEWDLTKGGACFHPSKQWLSNNGYNPEKAGDTEICHTRHFVKWSATAQPCMILHEMAHAYHHQVLGLDDERVTSAFKNAKEKKLYENVPHVNGSNQAKAYAMTNKKEYFSELTEAYFGKNDIFPFTRDELKKHDPVGYRMMVDCWGLPKE